jgi:hypothetical protein
MSKFKDFILKHDKTIVLALITMVPTLLVLLAFMPMVIENYTFNAFLNGERDNYLDFSQSFKFMQLFAFGYMIVGIVYNIIRRMAVDDIINQTGPYLNGLNVAIAFVVSIVIAIAIFTVDSSYEKKNIVFIQSKLVDIKKYIQDGKCDPARPYTESAFDDPKWGNISDCSTIAQKLPGTLYFRHSGDYTTSGRDDDGVMKTETKNEPNTITYRGYFGPFCRDLKDKDNILYKEFSDIQVHGTSPLSDKFEQSSCETHKNIGQIQLMFK